MGRTKRKQEGLFNVETDIEKHWKGMPEFIQKEVKPHRVLTVRFRNEEDVQAFAKLLGIKIQKEFLNIWFPQYKKTNLGDKIYVNKK